MNREKIQNRPEFPSRISLELPVVESFNDSSKAAEVWPEEISSNAEFIRQLEDRRKFNDDLNNVFDRIPQPDMALETAIDQNHITEEQAAKLYDSLSQLFESGKDYGRLILYLPFEILPAKSWQPKTEGLRQSAERFRQAYSAVWNSLLATHDVRANFVDGDVLEVEKRQGDLPRVVKAAHLIPRLIEKGIMTVETAISLMEENADPVLKDSIADTLPVLDDLGLLSADDLKRMEESSDRLVGNMAKIIGANRQAKPVTSEIGPRVISFSSVQQELAKKYAEIEQEKFGDATEARIDWLRNSRRQDAIEEQGKNIRMSIADGKINEKAVAEFLSAEADKASQQALVEGIRLAIESLALSDIEKTKDLYGQYHRTLLTLWENNDSQVRDALAKAFRRLRQLNVADDKQLADLSILIPKLAGPFSENLDSMKGEMDNVWDMASIIESSPELSRLVYPVVLVYGSRLKGYGEQSADIDLAVFVRPDTAISEKARMRELLGKACEQINVHGAVTEFWLEENGGKLQVRDLENSDPQQGESYWTHILFGAGWEGDKETINELRNKLLAPYLFETGKIIEGRDARGLYLEELERDTLQYRLMHKGYERFFPPAGKIHTAHSDEIDGDSAFFDSGYRQLATRLFVRRVFLPQISANENKQK